MSIVIKIPNHTAIIHLGEFWLRFRLVLFGPVKVYKDYRGLEYYVWKCKDHGYQIDYVHGFEGWNRHLQCSLCEKPYNF